MIEFADINFKNALLQSSQDYDIVFDLNGNSIAIDVNGDGKIEQSEADNVSEIYLSYFDGSRQNLSFFSK